MTGDTWGRVREALANLLEMPECEREAALAELQAREPAVAGEVASLLKEEEAGEIATSFRRIGEYDLLREIGRGGSSMVFEAVKEGLDRKVALKLLLGQADGSAPGATYQREQRALARLSHSGIVTLLDAGKTSGGLPYLVLELVEGVPIDDFCRCLPRRDAVAVFAELVAAANAAHTIGIVHRDLKPANVLVEQTGAVKLLDFGVAQIYSVQQTNSPMALTLAYASPEQLRGEPAGMASDVYSMGVILYELMAGRSPYAAATTNLIELMEEICNREIPEPGNVDRELGRIIAQCLRKNPAERYPSAGELLADIESWRQGRPVAAMGRDPLYRLGKGLRAHWRPVAMVAAVALVVGWTAVLSGRASADGRSRVNAETKSQAYRQAAAKMINVNLAEIEASLDEDGWPDPRRKAALVETLASLATLADDRLDPELLYQLGVAHQQMGRLQRSTKEALVAHEYYFQLYLQKPGDVRYRLAMVRNFLFLGELFEDAGDYRAAYDTYRAAGRHVREAGRNTLPQALVKLVEAREATELLLLSRRHLGGAAFLSKKDRALSVLMMAEAEWRNGLREDAERSYQTAVRVLGKMPGLDEKPFMERLAILRNVHLLQVKPKG